MRAFYFGKDGGAESCVWGFWLVELKRLFSIVLLCFEDGTRDAYHSHAFAAVSWVLRGRLEEEVLGGERVTYRPSWRPVWTPRDRFHKVRSVGRSWVLSFRGPWRSTWYEFVPPSTVRVLTHGRRIVESR
jgi:quercetin dioxygenase-like cupin family protein